jgi:PIN domain nuclease of toxin-antitoxin system
MIYIMDASAMLASLHDEAGADVIETYLLEPGSHSLAHSTNLCEVFYDFVRAESEGKRNKPLPTC